MSLDDELDRVNASACTARWRRRPWLLASVRTAFELDGCPVLPLRSCSLSKTARTALPRRPEAPANEAAATGKGGQRADVSSGLSSPVRAQKRWWSTFL